MEYISAVILALVLLAIVWGMARQEKRKEMDAMVEKAQKLCQARLRENMKGEREWNRKILGK